MAERNRQIFKSDKYCEDLDEKCSHLIEKFAPMSGHCREFKQELDGINCCYLKCSECLIEYKKENDAI